MTQHVPTRPSLELKIPGFSWGDLHDPQRLHDLMDVFDAELSESDVEAANKLALYRKDARALSAVAVSDTILSVAPHIERFVAKLFGVDANIATKAAEIRADDPVFAFKRDFAKKRVLKASAGTASGLELALAGHVARTALEALGANFSEGADEELEVAKATLLLHECDETARKVQKSGGAVWTPELSKRVNSIRAALLANAEIALVLGSILNTAAAAASFDEDAGVALRTADAIEAWLAARARDHHDVAHRWSSLHQPHKWNFEALVPLRRSRDALPEEFMGELETRRERTEPFALTDARGTMRQVANQVDYCLYCHDREKDSCSKGLHDKTGATKKNPLGVELNGCPLCEKISEMHTLRREGGVISSLATIMLDNPMLAGTGHRICNDCMKGCIYQTQEPVDIPQVETRILVDVLNLPWGFEIFSLLSRWNPLHARRPVAAPYNGKNVLVVGLGPAGYTLAHHLVNEGFGVVGIDGLKIEPLPKDLVGDGENPGRPVYDVRELHEPLEARVTLGFGGVSEYGITVRWDKNFLTLLYLNLARRKTFRVFGGVRFGGTIDLDDAWKLGIDHVAIAAGAGKPTLIPIKNNLIRGVRKASDLLMGLQLSGAYKRNSLANLQVRLPAVVIGGGLTAIDTATELLAYYVVQAEKTLERFEVLSEELGSAHLLGGFDDEERGVLREIVEHGKQIRDERERAKAEHRAPHFQSLLDSWGGVSIVYRRTVKESPAYRLNHEEVTKSLEEGVRYVELMSPVEAHPDKYGAVESMSFERQGFVDGKLRGTGEMVTLPARTVCIAAGTSPNTTYEQELPGAFRLDKNGYFQNHRVVVAEDGKVSVAPSVDGSGFFTSYEKDGHTVSYYGDNHPTYAGSVVKAMASARDGYPHVTALFEGEFAKHTAADQPARDAKWKRDAAHLAEQLTARVHLVRRLTPTIVEVVVHAPLAAKKFLPGQFYRLQNFERHARVVDNTKLQMEGLALTGAWTDPDKGLMSTIVLEMGASSRMCAMLQPGEEVVLMGPTGAPTHTPAGETVLLAGGGLGNAVLFSIARAFKAGGAKVIYFAGYKTADSVFKMDEIEASTDQVVWSADHGTIAPRRAQDKFFAGNIIQSMVAYATGTLGEKRVALNDVNRIIAIGSDRMMAAVKDARHGVLAPHLQPNHHAIGSINSPMQCMMKQICAQCMQQLVDPETGKTEIVYTCFNQDLPLDRVDFAHLATRLRQNSMQEKLTDRWFDKLLRDGEIPRV